MAQIPATEKLWRVGRKVGRTVYVVDDRDESLDSHLIGVMDTPALAAEAVRAHNERLGRENLIHRSTG